MEFINDVWEWVVAVVEHWHGWVSGGALAFVLEIVEKTQDWKPSKKWFLVILTTGFIWSMFSAWRDQYREALALRNKLNDNIPHFVVTIGQAVTSYRPDRDVTLVIPFVQITNTGANSTVSNYRAHYSSKSLAASVKVVSIDATAVFPFVGGASFTLRPEDLIVNKTTTGIMRGLAGMGRIIIVVPGDRRKELSDSSTLLTLYAKDYLGVEYQGQYRSSGEDQEELQLGPGELGKPNKPY